MICKSSQPACQKATRPKLNQDHEWKGYNTNNPNLFEKKRTTIMSKSRQLACQKAMRPNLNQDHDEEMMEDKNEEEQEENARMTIGIMTMTQGS